jgi:hypothetical protein
VQARQPESFESIEVIMSAALHRLDGWVISVATLVGFGILEAIAAAFEWRAVAQ